MFSLRVLAPLALAAGIAAASPAGAGAEPAEDTAAHARGGGAAVLTYPSIVDRKLVRTQSSLGRATQAVDSGSPSAADNALTAARKNLSKAWAAAKYVIKTTPPPPPTDDRAFHRWAFRRSGKLRIEMSRHHGHHPGTTARGGAPAGLTYASIYDTAFAVLSLQHYASTVSVDLLAEANGNLLNSVQSTLVRAHGDRNKAIAYIHSITPPPPPADRATAPRGGAVVGSWGTVMPQNVPYLDDEIQQIRGTLSIERASLSAQATDVLTAARKRDVKTKATVNQYWPPVPAEG